MSPALAPASIIASAGNNVAQRAGSLVCVRRAIITPAVGADEDRARRGDAVAAGPFGVSDHLAFDGW